MFSILEPQESLEAILAALYSRSVAAPLYCRSCAVIPQTEKEEISSGLKVEVLDTHWPFTKVVAAPSCCAHAGESMVQ